MAWVESHQDLRNHPKTARFRRRLGVSLPTAIGHLHMLWWWSLSYAEDGKLGRHDDDVIADAGGWEGDSSTFVEALVIAGFLDDDRTIHDWDHYTGRLQEKREANRIRQQRWREKNANPEGAASSDPKPDPTANGHVTRDETPDNAVKPTVNQPTNQPVNQPTNQPARAPAAPIPKRRGEFSRPAKALPWNDEATYGKPVTVEGITT